MSINEYLENGGDVRDLPKQTNPGYCSNCKGLDDESADCENCNGSGFEPESICDMCGMVNCVCDAMYREWCENQYE